jgi:hypothetical protein
LKELGRRYAVNREKIVKNRYDKKPTFMAALGGGSNDRQDHPGDSFQQNH